MGPVRVLVVDDHETVRAGLASILSHQPNLLLVGAFVNAEDAIDDLEVLAPDVIVLDHRLGGMNGAAACSEIMRRRPGTAVLILTGSCDDDVLSACVRAGARGFLVKNADASNLVEAVRCVAGGQPVMAPDALDTLLGWVRTWRSDDGRLLPQEVTTLSLIAKGLKSREIAKRLKVTEGAVKGYLNGARKKLGARDRSEAVLAGIRRGVI